MKTKIVIKEENRDRIEKVLNEVQRRTRARELDADMIFCAVNELNRRIIPFVKKKHLKETTACVDMYADNFPMAYRGVPKSTYFRAQYNGKEWVLIEVGRAETSRRARAVQIDYTEEAKRDIVERMTIMEW